MNDLSLPTEGVAQLELGLVVGFGNDGVVLVSCDGCSPAVRGCELLHTGREALRLAPGDRVLYWYGGDGSRGVLLGRIGQRQTARTENEHPPDELVLEAKSCLTLRVGSGSITIREDGKILIKGKDLVSHATRLNRIKGGAVQIN